MRMTYYGRNKNFDNEIKIRRRPIQSGSSSFQKNFDKFELITYLPFNKLALILTKLSLSN